MNHATLPLQEERCSEELHKMESFTDMYGGGNIMERAKKGLL